MGRKEQLEASRKRAGVEVSCIGLEVALKAFGFRFDYGESHWWAGL